MEAPTHLLPSRRTELQRTHTAGCSFCAQRSRVGVYHAPVSTRAPIFPHDHDAGDLDLAPVTRDGKTPPWADLGDGPSGLIAERVLGYDVADYIRFRAVCRSWRRCAVDPRAHGGLDRRFHPWRWTMLRDKQDWPDCRRRFLNTSTADCVQVGIPELHDHEVVASTPEGLLVLIHKLRGASVRLLNPLTRHLIELPPLTTLLPREYHYMLNNYCVVEYPLKTAWGSGIANDGSTVVLCFHRLRVLGLTKPGDGRWTLLKYRDDCKMTTPLMLAGRFYCVNLINGLMVLETGRDQPPRLQVAAKINFHVSSFAHSVHLVDNFGELMVVHRREEFTSDAKQVWRYDLYKVDLDTGTATPVKTLGGAGRAAVFMGMYCSLAVSLDVFPSSSISADTIYLSFDVSEKLRLEVGSYHLADGSIQRPNRYMDPVVPRPHTLVDCLSLSNTIES